MMSAAESEAAGPHRDRTYSAVLWRVLTLLAVAVALLPIPVAGFRALPMYRAQAQFLTFFAPLACLLFLAYLLYIRDALARFMFKDVLEPVPEYYAYYRHRLGDIVRRRLRRLRVLLLSILPALLLLASFYCVMVYLQRLDDSIALAARVRVVNAGVDDKPGLVPTAADSAGVPREGRAPASGRPSRSPIVLSRGDLLRRTDIDDIPLFFELSALYIGAFAIALTALIVMALKEYAKEALGLSERELVLRRSQRFW
jgi:hypothetical protein